MVNRKTNIKDVLAKVTTANEVPKIIHIGKPRLEWGLIVSEVQKRKIVKLSEKDVNIHTVANGVRKEAEKQKLKITANFRKINGVTYLYLVFKS